MDIIVVGNPFDGMRAVGPFPDGEKAHEWADSEVSAEDWWCVNVEPPSDEMPEVAQAMSRIAWILAAREWSVSMLEDIGEIVRMSGFEQPEHDDYVSH